MTQKADRLYFDTLESLRGVAALVVVLYHIGWVNPVYGIELIRNGALMVDLFFVLSGFVILHSYGSRIETMQNAWRFMWLRLGRLYPLHFTFLFVFLGIEILKYIAENGFGLSAKNAPFENNDFVAFGHNLLLTHMMGGLETETFNGPSWSISTEFYTYLLFAMILVVFKNVFLRNLVFALMVVLSLVVIVGSGHRSLTFVDSYSFFRCTFGFFIGALIYQFFRFLSARSLRWDSGYLPDLGSILVLMMLLSVTMEKHDDWREFLVPPIVGALVLSLVLSPGTMLSAFLSYRPFVWLGKVSYSIYMVHMAVLWGFFQVISVVMQVPSVEIGRESVLETSQPVGFFLMVVAVSTVLTLSHFTYKYIEDPFRKKSRKLLDAYQRSVSGISRGS